MNRIIECRLDSTCKEIYTGIWQHDYGQILRITGVDLPKAVEVQFSLRDKGGDTLTRIGTTVDGVTEVKVPDSFLKNENCTQNYLIYAWIYVTNDTSGNTEYQIILHVKSRPKPEEPSEEPLPEPNIFHETVEAVNAAADRAEQAEQNAKASAIEAGKSAASASESAVAAEKTKEDALKEVGEKKQKAIEAIQEQEETSVGNIINHTDNEIQRIQNQTASSKRELEHTITNAGVSKEELDESIQTAGDTKTALDKSTELAGTAKTELDTSTQKAGEAKTALDGSARTAGEMQETLSATAKQAGALDASLGEKIETGTELKTDLVASGKKAVQDIKTAGSEQLDKMQTVAEEFTADREQITTNKEDIGSLKEDLSDKITKFYASNQGETHLADSDNGKIMDMMLYGRSEQKQYRGKNLLKIRDGAQTTRGVTVTAKDGVVALKGTATGTGWAILDVDSFVLDGTYIFSSNITGIGVKLANKSYKEVLAQNKSKTLENEEVSKVCFAVTMGKTYDASNILIQVEKGSEATSYEPYVGGQPSPNPNYPQRIKSVVNPTVKVTNEDETESQTVTLPYALNAIPVSSGGNVTIGEQQYISDYLDIEKGKLYRKAKRLNLKDVDAINIAHGFHSNGNGYLSFSVKNVSKEHRPISNRYKDSMWTQESGYTYVPNSNTIVFVDDRFTDKQTAIKLVQDTYVIYVLSSQTEEDLSLEQIESLKSLSTYYPVTNITVGSEELDGYTVFNYPISMANGWNYVKKQLGDTRDYIYDMDAKAQDIDIQSAEAYVNSEYAVALTELEVM